MYHHVLADGLGCLALLAALATASPSPPDPAFPRPSPRYGELVVDAVRQRLRRAPGLPGRLRRTATGLRELGIGAGKPQLAERTSLNRPTSDRRRLNHVAVSLTDVVALAHRTGGTVNDVVLAAVTGGLMQVLDERGEHPARIVVSVPVSGRRETTSQQLGNDAGVRPVAVPTIADHRQRLATISTLTGPRVGVPRASSAGPLGLVFRALDGLGLFRLFVQHQRLVHTFETNLRGPLEPVLLGGHPLRAIIPAAVNPGNVGVSFDVLSYHGSLGVTIITDPALVGEPARLADALAGVFDSLLRP